MQTVLTSVRLTQQDLERTRALVASAELPTTKSACLRRALHLGLVQLEAQRNEAQRKAAR